MLADDSPEKHKGLVAEKIRQHRKKERESRNRLLCMQELEYYMRNAHLKFVIERRNNLTNDAKTLG